MQLQYICKSELYFYRAMLRRARYCYDKSSPSFRNVEVSWSQCWNSSKILSRLVSLGRLLSADPNQRSNLRGHPEILAGIWWGMQRWLPAYTKALISERRQHSAKITIEIGSPIRAFDWCQNQRPWMTLKGYYALFSKTRAPWCCYLLVFSSHSVCF